MQTFESAYGHSGSNVAIAFATTNGGRGDQISPVFGRTPTFTVFKEPESADDGRVLPNPAFSQRGGAGIAAAQFILDHNVTAAVAGNVGPNAMRVLQAAGVAVYITQGTVADALAKMAAGELAAAEGPTVGDHHGIPQGGGRRHGRGPPP